MVIAAPPIPLEPLLAVLDMAGVAVFAVSGALAAARIKQTIVTFAFFAAVTGIGGGIVRDVLTARVPVVFQAEIYALAALLGALVVVLADTFGLPPTIAVPLGAAVCFFLRLMAIYRGWRLPTAARGTSDTDPP
jgi:uncharacterized membrane protein YeiH